MCGVGARVGGVIWLGPDCSRTEILLSFFYFKRRSTLGYLAGALWRWFVRRIFC